ncbi:MAG: HAD family hydrolase [Candidatus Bathyarchaeota archaeon]
MKVLCFDLDGTLCDLWEGEMIAKFKLRTELAKLADTPEDMVGRIYDIAWAQIKQRYMNMVADGLGEMEIRHIHMKMVLEELWIDEEPEKYARLHMETMLENMHIYPDAAQVIEQLGEKYHITMITNGAQDLQREKIKRLGFMEHFQEIIVSQELGYHKPSREIFDEMAKRTNTEPSEIVYIGNDYQKDIVGAHLAGWRTVWVNRNDEAAGETEPDWTIRELSELRGIF